MTLTELRKKALESTDIDWLNNIEVEFNFDYINELIKLKGITTIYEFLLKQIDGWNKLGDNMPMELSGSKSYFENIRRQIESLITNGGIRHQWQTVVNQINTSRTKFPFKYNSPEVEFLLKVKDNHPSSFVASYNFIIGSSNIGINSKQSLIGAILAYEFSLKDSSQIVKRAKAETSSLKTFKTDLENYFSEAESDLLDHLKMIKEKYSESVTTIDDLKNQNEKKYNEWFDNTKDNFTQFNEDSIKKVRTIETTYEELLSLKKPAEYWKLRASELKSEGWKSLYWLIGLVGFACLVLYSLLWLTPDAMLKSFFDNDKSAAVRWSIIFITLMSVLFFGIKALSKLTFSSFHLARDAEERERLTYVYLAMIKDSSIDKEDRHLIMQSLFSRADTGLLKDDSSPTMPGTIIEKVIR
jgi:hypothetical protein